MFKKPEFPKVLEAFIVGRDGPMVSYRQIVYSKIEEDGFLLAQQSKKANRIREGKLSKKELAEMGFAKIILYHTPKWAYWAMGIIWTFIVAFITKRLTECPQ